MTISLDSQDRGLWIKRICEEQAFIKEGKYYGKTVRIVTPKDLCPESLKPVHLVTLACLVHALKKVGASGHIEGTQDLMNYLKEDIHLDLYFSSSLFHVESKNKYDLNLWKIEVDHIFHYSDHLTRYLQRNFFSDRDVSGIKVILDELFANIADHSHAKGTAFSFINYNESEKRIYAAFCDFGIGIRQSLSKSSGDVPPDAIRFATTKGVSAKSNSHNRGFGLDIVLEGVRQSGGSIRILSDNELFVAKDYALAPKTIYLPFRFNGTLVYFDFFIEALEEEDFFEGIEL